MNEGETGELHKGKIITLSATPPTSCSWKMLVKIARLTTIKLLGQRLLTQISLWATIREVIYFVLIDTCLHK